MAQADAALVGAVALAAFRAIWLSFGLTLAVALKGDGDREGILEAHRLDDEGFLLFFGATASSRFNTEGDLGERSWMKKTKQLCVFIAFLPSTPKIYHAVRLALI